MTAKEEALEDIAANNIQKIAVASGVDYTIPLSFKITPEFDDLPTKTIGFSCNGLLPPRLTREDIDSMKEYARNYNDTVFEYLAAQ